MTLELRGIGYTYPGSATPAVDEVTASVRPGEKVLLTGRSGCGKSTLIRLAAGLLQRFGEGTVRGRVAVEGRDPATVPPSERAGLVGWVSQDPGDQVITGTVGDEIAFAPESAGWAAGRIEARIGEMLEAVGLAVEPERDPRALSGGQQQRLVVAATLAVGAPLLLLDEPLAQLDPVGARELLARLDRLAAGGAAILLVEHRLAPCLPWADRVWWLHEGRLRSTAGPRDLDPEALREGGLLVPELLEVERLLRARGRSLTERGIDPLDPDLSRVSREGAPTPVRGTAAAPEVLAGRGLRWDWNGVPALRGVDLQLRAGDRLAVLGANGAGKSTLLLALAGHLDAGPVDARGSVLAVPQDPDLSLFTERVHDEIAYGPREQRASDVAGTVEYLATGLGIGDLLDRAPHALSRGQRLRVAVAAALACEPEVLLLDEPTAGQDQAHVEAMFQALGTALADNALVFATHDVRLALRHATRILVLHEGTVVAEGPPGRVLYTLPDEVPVLLPPLAALCRALGWPLLDPATFADRWA